MKFLPFLTLLLFFTDTLLATKARLGEYFTGIGYSVVDGDGGLDDREGQFIRFNAHAPNNSHTDVHVYVDYGRLKSNGNDATSWNLGIDYLAIFDEVGKRNIQLRPSLGIGVGFLDDESPIRLQEDGFTWNLILASEMTINKSMSVYLGGRFWGLWSEFTHNEFVGDAGFMWWIDSENGVSLQYERAFEAELNYFTLNYLYSWQ